MGWPQEGALLAFARNDALSQQRAIHGGRWLQQGRIK